MESQSFTRIELYELVWSQPILTLSNKYSISDVGLRKICVKNDIPLPKAGYWQKLKFGRKVKKLALPPGDPQESLITLKIREVGELPAKGELSPAKILQQEIENELGSQLTVPARLSKPDELIIAAKNSLLANNEDRFNYIGIVHTDRDHLKIKVTKENILRALLFYDTLLKMLRKRGFDIQVRYDKTYVITEDYSDEIVLLEKTKIEIQKDGNYNRTKYKPIGILALRLAYKEWKDGRTPLEQQLSRIIVHIELAARSWQAAAKKRRKEELERKEKERIQKEFETLREKELNDFKDTLQKATRWHKANNLRNYINEIESRMYANSNDHEDITNWLAWARSKADWYDPFIEKEDPLLTNMDKDTLSIKPPSKKYGEPFAL